MNNILQIPLIIWLILGCQSSNDEKINGVSLVGPRYSFPFTHLQPVAELGAGYVAIIPFAFSRPGEPAVTYGQEWQWWGEKPEGVISMLKYAREHHLKIMLKPHVWVARQGWPGEFALDSEEDWQLWEKDYEKYILDFAKIADSLQVEIFCIGTEYRIAVKDRPGFWRQLIEKVRSIYPGKLTYASNWDNYANVDFWQYLDYIGINSYWALSADMTPSVEDLIDSWSPTRSELKTFAYQNDKQILFTEYGYQSIDFTGNGHWNSSADFEANMQAQANAYRAIYEVFWQEDWFAGGFLWKWFPDHLNAGGPDDKRFTPQRKSAENVIREQFSQK